MPTWKVLITDSLEESGLELLRAQADVDDRPNLPAGELLETIANYDALVVRGRTRVTAPVLEAGSRLVVVGRAGVGVDNIDLGAAREKGVLVVNSPTATTVAVAEHTLALMLSLSRSVPAADSSMKAGRWAKKTLAGVELAGKTLGLIGMGRIGAEVARRAAAFGMTVLGQDPLISPDDIRKGGAEAVALDDLFARADFISLHIPLTTETRHLIDGQALAAMRPGVRLICAARGGVIDEAALLDALDSGHVAGAALDVFEQEPPGETALVSHSNVVATPHIGGQTREAQRRAAEDIASEVLAALAGEPLRWKVT
jgi:D-3-phosphoglycerate dehydrogenase